MIGRLDLSPEAREALLDELYRGLFLRPCGDTLPTTPDVPERSAADEEDGEQDAAA